MCEGPVRQLEADFARHDLFLHALLGALHRVEQVEARLRHVQLATDATEAGGPVEEPLALILGCVALGRQLRERVLSSCPAAEQEADVSQTVWDRSLWR